MNQPLVAVPSPEGDSWYCGSCGRGHRDEDELHDTDGRLVLTAFQCGYCRAYNALPFVVEPEDYGG